MKNDKTKSYTEDDLLPLSALVDIVFCERRAALHQLEQMWTENVATVEGHHLPDTVHAGERESRGDVRIARGPRLRSLTLGVSGIADVVEFHRAERGARLPWVEGFWMPFPVEYKRGVMRHEESFEVQLCAQALCLEEMLSCQISDGALFYGLSRRRKDVSFTPLLRQTTEQAANRLRELLATGVTPKAIYEKKCEKCSLLHLCMPETAGRGKSAAGYLKAMLERS